MQQAEKAGGKLSLLKKQESRLSCKVSNTVTKPFDPNKSNRNKTICKSKDVGTGSEQSPLAGEVGAVDF